MDNDKLTSILKITAYDFDPNATALTDIAWVDMRDISALLVKFFRTIGTGTIVLKILANTASDGTGDEATIATKTFSAGQPDAVGDYVFLEVLAEQVRQQGATDGKDYRYCSAQISSDAAGDEGVVTYIAKPRFKYENLTADNISS